MKNERRTAERVEVHASCASRYSFFISHFSFRRGAAAAVSVRGRPVRLRPRPVRRRLRCRHLRTAHDLACGRRRSCPRARRPTETGPRARRRNVRPTSRSPGRRSRKMSGRHPRTGNPTTRTAATPPNDQASNGAPAPQSRATRTGVTDTATSTNATAGQPCRPDRGTVRPPTATGRTTPGTTRRARGTTAVPPTRPERSVSAVMPSWEGPGTAALRVARGSSTGNATRTAARSAIAARRRGSGCARRRSLVRDRTARSNRTTRFGRRSRAPRHLGAAASARPPGPCGAAGSGRAFEARLAAASVRSAALPRAIPADCAHPGLLPTRWAATACARSYGVARPPPSPRPSALPGDGRPAAPHVESRALDRAQVLAANRVRLDAVATSRNERMMGHGRPPEPRTAVADGSAERETEHRGVAPTERAPADEVRREAPRHPRGSPARRRDPVPAAVAMAPAPVMVGRPGPAAGTDPRPTPPVRVPAAIVVRSPVGFDTRVPHRAIVARVLPGPVTVERAAVHLQFRRQVGGRLVPTRCPRSSSDHSRNASASAELNEPTAVTPWPWMACARSPADSGTERPSASTTARPRTTLTSRNGVAAGHVRGDSILAGVREPDAARRGIHLVVAPHLAAASDGEHEDHASAHQPDQSPGQQVHGRLPIEIEDAAVGEDDLQPARLGPEPVALEQRQVLVGRLADTVALEDCRSLHDGDVRRGAEVLGRVGLGVDRRAGGQGRARPRSAHDRRRGMGDSSGRTGQAGWRDDYTRRSSVDGDARRHELRRVARLSVIDNRARMFYIVRTYQSFRASSPGAPSGRRTQRQSEYEQNHWNRPGNHQLGRGRHGRRRADRHHQPRGRAADAVGGGLHQDRRAAGRPGGEAPGGHQPREHRLLDQAVHGAPVQRGDRRDDDGALQGGAGAQRRRAREGAGQGLHAAGDLRDDPAEAQAGRGGAPRPAGHAGGHHGAGLLQRRAAPGDQGRRPDRRPRGQAHRQRADGGGAGLRPRQEEGRDDCRLRLRRRHVRHLDPRSGRGRRRGEVHQRRHAPGRRQPRPARSSTGSSPSSRRPTASTSARTAWRSSG